MGFQPSQRDYVLFMIDGRRGERFFSGTAIVTACMLLLTKFYLCSCEAGKMTQWLESLALPENQGSSPSPHTATHTNV